MDKGTAFAGGLVVLTLAYVAFWLALGAGVIYAAIHFIHKVW